MARLLRRQLGTAPARLRARRNPDWEPRAKAAQGRSLEVVTTQLRPGYLRKNGPPYSANTVLKEYFDLSKERNGDTWFAVTTVVEDPHVFDRALRHQHQLEEGSRRRQVESDRLFRPVSLFGQCTRLAR